MANFKFVRLHRIPSLLHLGGFNNCVVLAYLLLKATRCHNCN